MRSDGSSQFKFGECLHLMNEMTSCSDTIPMSQTSTALSDEDSVESLLSDWNESNDDSKLQHLQNKFAFRDVLLKRMAQGKDEAYTEMIMRHESLIRDEAMKWQADVEKLQNGTEIKGVESYIISFSNNEASFTAMCKRCLLFEARLSLPGLLAVVFYCFTHLALYLLIESIVMEGSRAFRNEDMYYFVSFIVSLLVIRLTGGIWDWVSLKRHEVAKVELQRRFRVGYLDAKLHLWFRRRRVARLVVDYFAIYVCLVAMSHFHYRLFGPLFEDRSWILDKLPSRTHDVETAVAASLKRRLLYPECRGEVDQTCSLLDELTREDEKYLYSQVSITSFVGIMGYAGAHAATPFATRVLALISISVGIFVLRALGYQWD